MAGVDKSDHDDGASVEQIMDDPGAVVLKIVGEVDLAAVESLQPAVDGAIGARPNKIVFDLSGVRFMDSSGIAMLLTTAQRVGSIELAHPSTVVRRVIELAGLAAALPMTP